MAFRFMSTTLDLMTPLRPVIAPRTCATSLAEAAILPQRTREFLSGTAEIEDATKFDVDMGRGFLISSRPSNKLENTKILHTKFKP